MRTQLFIVSFLVGIGSLAQFSYQRNKSPDIVSMFSQVREKANNSWLYNRINLGLTGSMESDNKFTTPEKISSRTGPTITVSGFTNAAIQAAIDAAPSSGATIIIPAGRYIFTSECRIANKDNLTFSGAGSASTEFYVAPDVQISYMLSALGPVTNLRVTGITFNNQSSASGQGMVFSNENAPINGYEIDHCSFTAPNLNCNAIKLNAQTYIYGVSVSILITNVYIHDNKFYSIGRMGIELQNHGWEKGESPIYQLDGIRVEDNEFTDLGRVDGNNGMAFSITGPNQNIFVRRNKVTDAKYAAYEFVGSRDIEVSDNQARASNNSFTGISVSDNGHRFTTRLNFLRNDIVVKSNPFQIYGGDGGSVTSWVASNNIFTSTKGASGGEGSIKLQAASGGTFSNNTVRTGGDNAVFLDNSPQNTFTSNTFSNEDSPSNNELIFFNASGTFGNSLASSNYYKKQSGFVTTNYAVERNGAYNNLFGNPSLPPVTLRNPENPANAVAGLDYSYYEGSWNNLPDFSGLTPLKTGVNTTPDLSPKNRDNNYALRYTGYLSVPTDGVYTFYTTSDDGSKLFIGTTEVVNNDGVHPDQERSGTIGLKAGQHALSITYFQGSGGQTLTVSYSGPGVNKQLIPAGALFRVSTGQTTPTPPTSTLRNPENPANAVAGLDYSYYEGSWNNLPDFSGLTPLKTGVNTTPDLSPKNRDNNYALRYTGYLSVPTDGVYTFYTTSDDGSKLFIGTTEVVNNDGGHADQERSGTIGLKAGQHALSITYFQGSGGQTLTVSYSGPGVNKQLIPAGALFRVSTGQTTPTPPTSTLRNPENPANAVAGLDYSYYEGSWNNLPDFSGLTPLKTGVNTTPDLSPKNRDNNYALRYTGYLSVPTDGVYTFYTTSDDGSKLFIGTTEVVNNDGGHADQERSGTIGLKAGQHALSITYFQGGGGQTLTVSYSGPGVNKQLIPAGALFRVSTGQTTPTPPTSTLRNPENPANAVAGLDYSYYEGSWNNLPDFSGLTPLKTGVNTTPDLSPKNRDNNYALRYTGYLSVPTDGVYTFYTTSDDGSKLFIGTTEVVNNDGGHADQERSGTIGLKAGQHALSITYFQGGGGQTLTVSYSGPGVNKQLIPAGALFRVSTGQTTPTPPTSTLRNPENPANAVAGLDYSYYEGSWNNLPDFSGLTPLKTGVNTTPDLSPKNRDNNYALRYTGYLSVPTDGVYTFYTTSDDGSKLFIGTTEVVNNDGVHPDQERSGTIGLKAGQHALSITYFQGSGGQTLTVSYSGPGVNKQLIPAGALFRVSTGQTTPTTPPTGTPGSGTGLRAEYFNNKTLNGPIALTRTDATIDFNWGDGSPASGVNVDNFSVRWTGMVEAPVTGTYIFSTNADDGARLWVNGAQLINDWNDHAPITNNGAPVTLNAGQKYTITMEYFESGGGAVAKLLWSYPGQSQQTVPQGRLYPATTSSGRIAAIGENEPGTALQMEVYPVPAQADLWIRYYTPTSGEATVQLINDLARPAILTLYSVTPGENLIKIAVGQLNRGIYILSVTKDSQRLSRKVLLTN